MQNSISTTVQSLGQTSANAEEAVNSGNTPRPATESISVCLQGTSKQDVIDYIIETEFPGQVCILGNEFYSFTGKRWERADKHATELVMTILPQVKAFSKRIADIELAPDVDTQCNRKKAMAACDKIIDAPPCILKLLRYCPSVKKYPQSDFDSNAYLINCENGVLNLQTLCLEEHSSAHHITFHPVGVYDPTATCLEFLKFLKTIFNNDEELITYVQRVLGYGLVGSSAEHQFYIWHGPTGRNGKSVLANVVGEVLGDYAAETDPSSFIGRSAKLSNDIARLNNKRIVFSREPENGAKLNESKVKALTGGDKATVRFLYKEHFEMRVHFKLHLLTNYRPEVDPMSDSLWSRIRVIPFNIKIAAEEMVKALDNKLIAAEAAGILAWLAAGAKDYLTHGLKEPEAVTNATAAYRNDQEKIHGLSPADHSHGKAFIKECVELSPGQSIFKGEAYDLYRAHCTKIGLRPVSRRQFGETMKELGFERSDVQNHRLTGENGIKRRAWFGVRINFPSTPAVNNSTESHVDALATELVETQLEEREVA